MTLVPEGDPVIDKAESFCRIYARYRDALAADFTLLGENLSCALRNSQRLPLFL